MSRTIRIVVVVFALLLAACGDDGPPELTDELAAELSARAVAVACEQLCIGTEIPVQDLVYASPTTPLEGPPLSEVQRQALTRQFTDVTFLDAQGTADQVADGGVAIAIGPVSQDSSGRVVAEVAAERADGLTPVTQTFEWTGGQWIPVD